MIGILTPPIMIMAATETWNFIKTIGKIMVNPLRTRRDSDGSDDNDDSNDYDEDGGDNRDGNQM